MTVFVGMRTIRSFSKRETASVIFYTAVFFWISQVLRTDIDIINIDTEKTHLDAFSNTVSDTFEAFITLFYTDCR